MIIPIPKHDVADEPKEPEDTRRRDRWVTWFITTPPWKCACGGVMFGRMKYCLHCKNRGVDSLRPSWYIENKWEDYHED